MSNFPLLAACDGLLTGILRLMLSAQQDVRHSSGTVRQHELSLVPPFCLCMFLLFSGHFVCT